MKRTIALFLGRVSVEIVCPEETARVLHAVWAPAAGPIVPTELYESWKGGPTPGGFILTTPRGERSARTPSELAAVVESELIRNLTTWHPRDSLLHGALFELDETPYLVLGESGAGKSSLSLAAVRVGATYHSDEAVITDGEHVWGVGRSLVYDLCPPDATMPTWIADADRNTYRLELPGRGLVARPIVAVPAAQWATRPAAATSATIVHVLGRADTTHVVPLTGAEALAALFDAATTEQRRWLAPLASGRRAFQLRWRSPEEAITRLRAATKRVPATDGAPPARDR